MLKRQIFNLILLFQAASLGSCESWANTAGPESGIAKGRVTDMQGKPLANVHVFVDNSVFFNSGVSTYTDANGYYRVEVPQGSWRIYATLDKMYHGKRFSKIDLHPDHPGSFTGASGVVCNFQWRLSGEKPDPVFSHYGGTVNLYNNPGGNLYDVENIEFTFTPDGPLIDGSTGKTVVAKPGIPGGEFYSRIVDIPMGRYRVTAVHRPTGKTVKLGANDGKYDCKDSIVLEFEPELSFCSKCMAIVFSDK